jgi:hypothetical protein
MQQLLLVRLADLYLSWSLQLFWSGIMNKTMVEICRLGELLKLKLVRSVKRMLDSVCSLSGMTKEALPFMYFDKVEGLFIAASILVFYDVRFDISYFCFRVLLCA